MAIRKRLYHPEEVRQKIKTSQILNRLNAFIFGEIELSATQASVAVALLRKTMPDLSAIAHSGHVDTKPEEMTDAALDHIARTGRTGAAEAPAGQTEPGELH